MNYNNNATKQQINEKKKNQSNNARVKHNKIKSKNITEFCNDKILNG